MTTNTQLIKSLIPSFNSGRSIYTISFQSFYQGDDESSIEIIILKLNFDLDLIFDPDKLDQEAIELYDKYNNEIIPNLESHLIANNQSNLSKGDYISIKDTDENTYITIFNSGQY